MSDSHMSHIYEPYECDFAWCCSEGWCIARGCSKIEGVHRTRPGRADESDESLMFELFKLCAGRECRRKIPQMPRNSTIWTLLGQKLMQHASFQAGFSLFFYFSLCVFRLQEWLGCKRLPFASSYTSRLWHILIFADLQIRTGLSIEQPWNDVLPCFTWTSFMIFCGVTSWRVMWNWMKLGCPFVIVCYSHGFVVAKPGDDFWLDTSSATSASPEQPIPEANRVLEVSCWLRLTSVDFLFIVSLYSSVKDIER